jgi:hypothetical protein
MAHLRFPGALLIGLPLACAGCGGIATYPVTGTVRFEDGEPVPHGAIEFREEESGLSARARLEKTGQFVLGTFTENDGAPSGNYRVVVIQHFDLPPHANNPQSGGERIDHDHAPGADVRVASEFADFATSSLRAKVQPGSENKFELVVKRLRRPRSPVAPLQDRAPQ